LDHLLSRETWKAIFMARIEHLSGAARASASDPLQVGRRPPSRGGRAVPLRGPFQQRLGRHLLIVAGVRDPGTRAFGSDAGSGLAEAGPKRPLIPRFRPLRFPGGGRRRPRFGDDAALRSEDRRFLAIRTLGQVCKGPSRLLREEETTRGPTTHVRSGVLPSGSATERMAGEWHTPHHSFTLSAALGSLGAQKEQEQEPFEIQLRSETTAPGRPPRRETPRS